MAKFAALILAVMLAGCSTVPRIEYVAVPCKEDIPQRPTMPTEGAAWVDLDVFQAQVLAEVDRREAYEGELRTALINCKRL